MKVGSICLSARILCIILAPLILFGCPNSFGRTAPKKTYLALCGLYPTEDGWSQYVFENPDISASLSGNVVTLESSGDYGFWYYNTTLEAEGVSPEEGWYVTAAARVVTESHTTDNRGTCLAHLHVEDGININDLVLYAHAGQIILHDYNFPAGQQSVTLGNYAMDTTDRFHRYRVEMEGTTARVYVDGILRISATYALHLTDPLVDSLDNPLGADNIYVRFGDTSVNSWGETEWKFIRLGTFSPCQAPILGLAN